jgi:hypothetical protein
MRKSISWIIVLSLYGGVVNAQTNADLEKAALRAKLALMRVHTAVSSDRGVAVSGPRPEGNALLLQAVQQIQEDLAALVGMPLPFASQQLRVQVQQSDTSTTNDVVIRSSLENQGGILSHRIALPDYRSAYRSEAREHVVQAMLRIYSIGSTTDNLPAGSILVPVWLWRGVVQILDSDARNLTLAYIDALWRDGQIPPLASFFRDLPEENLSMKQRMIAGTIVYWLSSRLHSDDFFADLFAAIRAGKDVSYAWLEMRIGADPDEQFDRWLLAQDQTIRAVGGVMIPHTASLRTLLYIYPGQYGIPRAAEIPANARLSMLALHREADWFDRAILKRRQRIQLVGQGRHRRMQDVITAFLDILDGVEGNRSFSLLQAQEKAAHRLLDALDEDIIAAGGILQEEE